MTHKFTFTTYLYRGPREIEHEVEVTYSVSPYRAATMEQPAEGGEVEILSVKGVDYTSRDEDDGLYDQACDRANEDLAEWHAEQEEYRADAIRDERMMRDFQS
jgi:hypothetical protein